MKADILIKNKYIIIKSMNKFNKLFCCILVFAFSSCDYYGDYHYIVKNQLSDEEILIRVRKESFQDYHVYNLSANNEIKVLTTTSGNIGKHEDPSDIFKEVLSDFSQIEIFVGDSLINKDFKERKYWKFKNNGDQSSTYTLIIEK